MSDTNETLIIQDEVDDKRKLKKKKTPKNLKRFIFVIGWIYLFAKIFIIDLEDFLFNKFDLAEGWILKYRFLVLVAFSSCLWIYLGTLRFFKNLGHFIIFPFIVLLWHIPVLFAYRIPKKFIEKKYWILLLGYINSVISFFRNFKYNALILSLMTISLLALFNSSNPIIMLSIIVFFSLYLIYHFYRRARLAFQPINNFNLNIKALNLDKAGKYLIPEIKLTEEEKSDSAKLLKKENQQIESLLSTQIVLNFIGDKLERFKSKGVYLIYMLLKIIITFTLSIIIFTLINYALYKYSPEHFNIERENPVTIFDFLVYSFYSIAPDGVYVEPVSNIAWTLKMIASYIGIVLIGIFGISVISTITNKYEKTVEIAVNFSAIQCKEIEKHLLEKYSLGVKEAIHRLKKADSAIVEYLEKLDHLNQDKIE